MDSNINSQEEPLKETYEKFKLENIFKREIDNSVKDKFSEKEFEEKKEDLIFMSGIIIGRNKGIKILDFKKALDVLFSNRKVNPVTLTDKQINIIWKESKEMAEKIEQIVIIQEKKNDEIRKKYIK